MLTLFRMKLRGPDVSPMHDGREVDSVVRRRQDNFRGLRLYVVRVNEIHKTRFRDALRQPVRCCGCSWFQPMCGTRRFEGSFTTRPGIRSRPRCSPNSSLSVNSRCMPRQIPSVGSAGLHFVDKRFEEPKLAQIRDPIAERAHTRQNQLRRVRTSSGFEVTLTSCPSRRSVFSMLRRLFSL